MHAPIRLWRPWLVAILVVLLLPVAGRASEPPPATSPGRLVDTGWLARQAGRADLLLLDASAGATYRKQHIPGAVNADVFGYGPHEPTPAQVERRFQSWGVSPDKTVVVYDPGGTFLATRVFFELLHRGFPEQRLHVLDGGLAKWMAEGRPVTAEPTPAPAPGSFRVTGSVESVRARFAEFFAATGDTTGSAVIDALDADWHYGGSAFFDRGGHVPNARLWPSQDLFNADKTFKSPAELRRMLEHLGVKPTHKVITHCGGGVAASAPFFALRYLAGYPEVKLYVESQLEWLSDPRGLPLWTYAEPQLLRDAAWLRGWGGGMLRQYGMSRVSIVDVRPPADYAIGHVPFAVNLPAEQLGAVLHDPAALAELLGRSGVDRAHEAVIVSDGGIDRRAALAHLALWRVGQRQVSVLTTSPERWAQLGYEQATEPTTVGPRKGPGDRAVPVARYVAAPRDGVWSARPGAAGARPMPVTMTSAVAPAAPPVPAPAAMAAPPVVRVYVASGAAPPARAPSDAPVVHLPYTRLLRADGMPLPAGEMWKVISAAGVPRYAELVVFADDLADAAANHLLLRLMGFADVKVWQPG
jgi:3-mercaptopyruvate sulfurtransferase SseA